MNFRRIDQAREWTGDLKISTNTCKSGKFLWMPPLTESMMELLDVLSRNNRRLIVKLNGFVVELCNGAEPQKNSFEAWFRKALGLGLIWQLATNDRTHLDLLAQALLSNYKGWEYLTLEINIPSNAKQKHKNYWGGHAIQFGKALARNNSLKALRLVLSSTLWYKNEFMGPNGAPCNSLITHLSHGLAHNTRLEVLSLSGWDLSCLTRYFHALPPSLIRLHLVDISISPHLLATEEFTRVWKQLIPKLPLLSNIQISFLIYVNTDGFLENVNFSFLQRLAITFQPTDSKHPRNSILVPTAETFDQLLCGLNCPQLQILDFSNIALTSVEWVHYLRVKGNGGPTCQQLPNLEELWLPPQRIHAVARNYRLLYTLLATHPKLHSFGPFVNMPPYQDLTSLPLGAIPHFLACLPPEYQTELIWRCFVLSPSTGLIALLQIPWKKLRGYVERDQPIKTQKLADSLKESAVNVANKTMKITSHQMLHLAEAMLPSGFWRSTSNNSS